MVKKLMKYFETISQSTFKIFDHTIQTIEQLQHNHCLYIVTNGVTITQQRRIAQTNFNEIFDGIFISEQTGYQNLCLSF